MNTATPNVQSCCCSQKIEEPKTATFSKTKKPIKALSSSVLSLVIAFFPKCPVCWAAYMSMFGSFGLSNIPYISWLLPVLMLFLALHLYLIFKKVKEKGYGPFIVSLIGACIIIVGRTFLPFSNPVLFAGMAFILCGSLWNSFSIPTFKTSYQ